MRIAVAGYLEHRDVQLITATDNCRVIKKKFRKNKFKAKSSGFTRVQQGRSGGLKTPPLIKIVVFRGNNYS